MNFVKTNYPHEFGGQRVTPFGIINFNSSGVCAIADKELAQKVADCSPSLFLADEDDAVVQKAMAELKAADLEQNKPVDADAVGEFIKGAGAGAVVESSEETRSQVETIGVPAGESDLGSMEGAPKVEAKSDAPIIGTKAAEGAETEEAKEEEVKEELGDANEGDLKEEEKPEEEGSGEGNETNSDDLITSQLAEFEAKDIKEMIEAANIEIPEGEQTKESLIKIAVENKIMD